MLDLEGCDCDERMKQPRTVVAISERGHGATHPSARKPGEDGYKPAQPRTADTRCKVPAGGNAP